MKFSTGDKIVIRRSGEEGHIVQFIGTDMAEIEAGGTVFPIYLDEIDHPYLRWFTEKNKTAKKQVAREQVPVEKQEERPVREPSGIHLVFLPEYYTADMEERVRLLKVFLVNETGHTVKAKYEVRIREELIFSHEAILQPFSDLYLHYVDWEQMQDLPRFAWGLQEGDGKTYAAAQDVIKIKGARLFAHIHELQQENKASFRYTLLQTFLPKPKEQEPLRKPGHVIPVIKKSARAMIDIPRYEVDLHADQLIPDATGLDAASILELQLSTLRHALDLAIRNMQDRLLVIHGIGKGVLKTEVQRVLGQYKAVARFESGWQAGYGFGATIVYFSY